MTKDHAILVQENQEKCLDLIRSLFPNPSKYTLTSDAQSGHIWVETDHFWVFEFEFPCVEASKWYVKIWFVPNGCNGYAAATKPRHVNHLLKGESPRHLAAEVAAYLAKVMADTTDLVQDSQDFEPPPEPPPVDPALIDLQAMKVIAALQGKPNLLWQVAQDLSKLRLISPWSNKVEVNTNAWTEEDVGEDAEGEIRQVKQGKVVYTQMWRRQALGWEGTATVATVAQEGSCWMVYWVGCKAAVPNVSLKKGMELADRMLQAGGWTLL